jgi:hypothetical protein
MKKARPEWDLVCEKNHGCDPIPVTAEQIPQQQQTDPRCNQAESSDDRNE